MTTYEQFIDSKTKIYKPTGFTVSDSDVNGMLFQFQREIVKWACRRGRAAIFAGTGLGKTFMQIEWARLVQKKAGKVIILAPLAVAPQTVEEAEKLGVTVNLVQKQDDCEADGIYITNYQKLSKFDAELWGAVVLDESSIIKHEDAKTRDAIIEDFGNTPYRLACTATPAPNDYMELGNHAEFLGVMSMSEMLSMYFVHDGGETQKWRLKGHAQDVFNHSAPRYRAEVTNS